MDDTELEYGKTDTMFGIPIQDRCSAFTVAELGEMLGTNANAIMFANDIWASIAPKHAFKLTESETEADARAKWLIYLLENKLIQPS